MNALPELAPCCSVCPCNRAESLASGSNDGDVAHGRASSLLAMNLNEANKILRQQMQEWKALALQTQTDLETQQQETRLWQKRLDLVLDRLLCDECIEDKDDAYTTGHGRDWLPDLRCKVCRDIRHLLQAPMPQHADHFRDSLPLYHDDEPVGR